MITRGRLLSFVLTQAAILLGCAALATRPVAAAGALVMVLAVGAIGALAPLPPRSDARVNGLPKIPAIALGVLAFAAARWLAAPLPGVITAFAVGATIVAAVAEEIFFRRLVYGWLARTGDAHAIIGAAALFAIVHVPAYGIRVFPLDLAAGILFGWQRWATGGWIAPALTHAAANVLQIL